MPVIRTLLYLLAGLLLGGVIHIIVILILPLFATQDVWSKLTTLSAVNRMQVLADIAVGSPNPLGLDPELTYAVCQVSLATGPAVVSGVLPDAFWSLAILNRAGIVTYSTTNRDGLGQTLDLGIFNPTQTRLLAQQELEIPEGLLIVESRDDDVFVVVRLAPPHPAVRERFKTALSTITCGNIVQPT